MKLPIEIENKVEELYNKTKNNSLTKARETLTQKYKDNNKTGKKLIADKQEAVLYAITRMPCTYVVVRSLLEELYNEGFLQDIYSAIDVGAGTGAGYFALLDFNNDLNVKLLEYDENMIYAFNKIDSNNRVVNFNIVNDKLHETADLVISSYMLNELSEADKFTAVQNMYSMTDKYLLLIDAGTPKVYGDMMKIKSYVEDTLKGNVVAPCANRVCPLKDDYCQFYARVERSSLLRQSKSANLSYEDEKYFYLLIEKPNINNNVDTNFQGRVIRRPKISTNMIELVLCTNSGVLNKKITLKNKAELKQAKKIKINQIFR